MVDTKGVRRGIGKDTTLHCRAGSNPASPVGDVLGTNIWKMLTKERDITGSDFVASQEKLLIIGYPLNPSKCLGLSSGGG
jgi:hypothetical protein